MTGLITMCILSDQTCHISLGCFQFHCKQGIQLVQERFFSTKESNQTGNIVLHMPGILPCISFRIVTACTFRMSYITRIKRRFPGSVRSVTSAWVVSSFTVNRESSLFRKGSSPPKRAIKPGTSCCTCQVYCHAFPSV